MGWILGNVRVYRGAGYRVCRYVHILSGRDEPIGWMDALLDANAV